MRVNKKRTFNTGVVVEQFLKDHNLKGDNFTDTPKRVAQFWEEFLHPGNVEVKTFPLRTEPGMIIHRDIILWGFCPHHLLPIEYNIKIGYIPEKHPLGASKPVRIAQYVLSKLPLQEEIPQMIINEISKHIEIKGGGCIVIGEHLCMMMRGIKQPCADMVTDYLTGCFLRDSEARAEFIAL